MLQVAALPSTQVATTQRPTFSESPNSGLATCPGWHLTADMVSNKAPCTEHHALQAQLHLCLLAMSPQTQLHRQSQRPTTLGLTNFVPALRGVEHQRCMLPMSMLHLSAEHLVGVQFDLQHQRSALELRALEILLQFLSGPA